MGERKLIIDHLKFNYEGLFNVNEVYSVISTWFFEKGWDWYEKINQEQVTPEGRQIRIVLEPWKSVSNFYKLIIHIKLHFVDVKEVEVEHQGETLRLSQGAIRMTVDGYVMSDRSGAWTSTPFYWFLTILGQKYFFRDHFAKMEAWIRSDVDDLYNKIKNYLNVFKYTYQT
mgnify:CR=1 FL=1